MANINETQLYDDIKLYRKIDTHSMKDVWSALNESQRNTIVEIGKVYKDAISSKDYVKIYLASYYLYNKNEAEGVLECLSILLKREPTDYSLHNDQGEALLSLRRYPEAIQALTKALKLNDRYTLAYRNRGVAHYNYSSISSALDDITKAIELWPNYAEAYNNRGWIYLMQKNYHQAEKDFDQAIELKHKPLWLPFRNKSLVFQELAEDAHKTKNLFVALDYLKDAQNYIEAAKEHAEGQFDLMILEDEIRRIAEKQANLIDESVKIPENEKNENELLITRKAYYFINATQDSIISKYQIQLELLGKDKGIEFSAIKTITDINRDTNVVFIIAPLDMHDNDNLLLNITSYCKTNRIRFYILGQNGFIDKDFDSVNLKKAAVAQNLIATLTQQFPNEFKNFNSYDELNNFLYEALKKHKPNIRLTKLFLKNIGHFSDVEIPLNRALTCLIGENGTGKSTILRALALAIIGPDHKKIEEKTKRSFLKIHDFVNNLPVYHEGSIRLEYTIDGVFHFNQLLFTAKDNGNEVEIASSGDQQIVHNDYNLRTLICGFPQARGNDTSYNSQILSNKITQPHINDLIPLINNSDDFRLQSFAGWIVNLSFDSEKNKKANEETKEDKLITEAFHIISRITKKDIAFKTVKKAHPPEVWVTTYDSPKGVPLDMVSQGFKIVIGWLGYFMQRFVETFPLSEPKDAFRESAILILDEVDTSIHPVWQSSFIDILREIFPNTQFILSTHSPLMIAGLDKEQYVELAFDANQIIARTEQTDTWTYNYHDILQKLFDTSDPKPQKSIPELEKKLKETSNKAEQAALKEDIRRIKESEKFENEIEQLKVELRGKQTELSTLIEKYKAKTK